MLTGWLAALLLAVVLALLYVVLIRSVDRYEPDPWRLVLAAFALGAVTVPLVVMTLRVLVGQDFNLPLPFASDRPQPWVRIAEQIVAGLVLIAFLYWAKADFDDGLDAVVYGATMGAGLGVAHVFLYSVALAGIGTSLLTYSSATAIAISGLNDALYGATFGAFFGYAYWYLKGGRRWIVVSLGLLTAALMSALHDTLPYVISRLIDQPDAATGLAVRLISSSLNLLGFVALAVVVVHFVRHETNLMRRYLRPEVSRGTIDEGDYHEVTSLRTRARRQLSLLRHGRFSDLRSLRRLYLAEGRLAFHLWHATLGRSGPAADERADELRATARRLTGHADIAPANGGGPSD